MKIQIKFWHKIVLALAAFAVAIAGFMLKLPSGFSHSDKELHSLFYFLAAGFLNVLFTKKSILIHAFIFAFLYVFGWAIEYAQQYSNKFFSHRIHGNADPEDIHANLLGIIAFSAIWLCVVGLSFLWKTITKNEGAESVIETKEKS